MSAGERHHIALGVFYALATSAVGSSAAAVVKYLGTELSGWVIVWVQYALCTLIMLPWLVRRGPRVLHTRHPWQHLVRALGGWLGFTCYYLALPVIPLVDASLLRAAGHEATTDAGHGLDHGSWVPLSLMYPAADVPVFQLSVQTCYGPAHHLALGQALRPLREENVLILGSGSLTHNLRAFFTQDGSGATPGWVTDFADWTERTIAEGRTDDLLAYRETAPYAVQNHPTDEHFLPIFAALGAGSDGKGTRVHHSIDGGVLAMDMYRFD